MEGTIASGRDRRQLVGMTALVTGASSGIGAAVARELAHRGARVALVARRADRLEALASAIVEAGGEALSLPADLSDRAEPERLVALTLEHWSQIDILINAAGQGWTRPFAREDLGEIASDVDLNLVNPMLLTRAVLPGMLARRSGSIINVASIAGHVAVAPIYSATKYGLRGFSLALRRELAGSGVRVVLVSPGFIRTEMTETMRGIPMPRPERLARSIADAVRHPRREIVYPPMYHAAIWIERFIPGVVDLALRPRKRR